MSDVVEPDPAAHRDNNQRCRNGHDMPTSATYCPTCGVTAAGTDSGQGDDRTPKRRTLGVAGLVALLVVIVVVAVLQRSGDNKNEAGDPDAGDSSTVAAQPETPTEVRDSVAAITGCSLNEEEEPYGDSLAVAEFICGDSPSNRSFLFVYASDGSLSTDLAGVSPAVNSGTNAVVTGELWIYYTFSKSEVASLLDHGAELIRTMDPASALP